MVGDDCCQQHIAHQQLVQPVLDDLIAQGFWVREELYAEVLQLAGE